MAPLAKFNNRLVLAMAVTGAVRGVNAVVYTAVPLTARTLDKYPTTPILAVT